MVKEVISGGNMILMNMIGTNMQDTMMTKQHRKE